MINGAWKKIIRATHGSLSLLIIRMETMPFGQTQVQPLKRVDEGLTGFLTSEQEKNEKNRHERK